MMKMDSKLVDQGSQKAKHLAVLAFFLCALSSHAADNTATGLVYGDPALLATTNSILSVMDGTSTLRIQHTNTTDLVLGHEIQGSITITNSFDNFTIQATGSSLSASGATALNVEGGETLIVSSGFFSAGETDNPLFPSANPGAVISGTRKTTLEGTTIIGGSNSGIGAPALEINDGELIVTGDSVLTGGPGNPAIFATTTDLQISNGTFSAGTGGATLTLLEGSSATIHGGNFSTETDIPTFFLQDSDLFLHDGTVSNGSLYSLISTGKSSNVTLHEGAFDSLVFQGATDSSQFFTAGTNLVVSNGLFQTGGTMGVSNLKSNAFPTVRLSNGASITFLQAFTLPSGGTFWLDSGNEQASFTTLNIESNTTFNINAGQVSASYFEAGSRSTNIFAITSEDHGLIDAQTALFNTNSAMVIDALDVSTSTLQTNNYMLVSADPDQLFAGTTNTPANTVSFTNNVNVETLTVDRMEFAGLQIRTVDSKTILELRFTAMSLKEYWDLTNGTSTVVTEKFANELDQLASTEMLEAIDGFSSSTASLSAIEETYFTTPNTFQTTLQGLQAAVGQSVSRGAEFREQLKLIPPGAKGPERKNELRGWGKYYGQFYTHDAEGLNPEYDTELHGGVIGIDKSLGNLLLGLSGGGGNYSTTTGADGEENIRAYHGALYGTYGTDRAYFDAGIAYGFNEVETQTDGPFVLEGEFDAQIVSAYLGGGYDLIDTKGGTVFTPEASIQYSMYEQDAYSETSTTAVPRNIDAFDADSLRSSIGLNVSMLNTTALETFGFKLDGRVHWLHEFNPEPGNMTFNLEGGNNDYQLAHPLLDEDLFRAGFGFSFFNTMRQQPKNVLLRVDFDELFGDGFNSHNFSAKVIYAF